eukprot:CAMPEP_0202337656 /NCGR_PEP_ID=MMETSP1126-20121109/253_1 /ASSEMBLY_ACC=CAM_ASM_000457 /TAXON_ID=3047 /ORGANISM="Dunaliella tertiolecta, Strain CCMP1320" /LENGTH=121 /DNA_ID=CAMNT_0048927895 /DNA_START=514 /DNA_END=879 /DNA_ORIENTATION=+
MLHVVSIPKQYHMPSRAWHLTPDVDEVSVRVHLVNQAVMHGAALVAHVPRHLLALPHFARVGTAANGTPMPVRQRVAMRRWHTFEVPPLHHTLEAFPLGPAHDIYRLAWDVVCAGHLKPQG